jgi:hypothetical protein
LQELLEREDEPDEAAKVQTVQIHASADAVLHEGGPASEETTREVTKEAVEIELNKLMEEMKREATVRRVDAAELGMVQFTDADIGREQDKSAMVRELR